MQGRQALRSSLQVTARVQLRQRRFAVQAATALPLHPVIAPLSSVWLQV